MGTAESRSSSSSVGRSSTTEDDGGVERSGENEAAQRDSARFASDSRVQSDNELTGATLPADATREPPCAPNQALDDRNVPNADSLQSRCESPSHGNNYNLVDLLSLYSRNVGNFVAGLVGNDHPRNDEEVSAVFGPACDCNEHAPDYHGLTDVGMRCSQTTNSASGEKNNNSNGSNDSGCTPGGNRRVASHIEVTTSNNKDTGCADFVPEDRSLDGGCTRDNCSDDVANLCGDRLLSPAIAVADKLQYFWRVYLSIFVDSTQAAAQAVKAVAGDSEVLSQLAKAERNLHIFRRDLVEPLWEAGQKQQLGPALTTALKGRPEPDACNNSSSVSVQLRLRLSHHSSFFSNMLAMNALLVEPPPFASDSGGGLDFSKGFCFFDTATQVLERDSNSIAAKAVLVKVLSRIELVAEKLVSLTSRSTSSESTADFFVDSSQLRFIVILLGSSLFEQFPFQAASALGQLFNLVAHLPEKGRNLLIEMYARIPARDFRRSLVVVQQIISTTCVEAFGVQGIFGVYGVAARIRSALNFIKVLYSANELRRKLVSEEPAVFLNFGEAFSDYIIPCQEFYNDAINTIEEIVEWDMIRGRRNQSSTLGLIKSPFVLDVTLKAKIVATEATMAREIIRGSEWLWQLMPHRRPYFVIHVRRNELLHDALTTLTRTFSGPALRRPLKVIFDEEEGVDEGGVAKEFFQLLVAQLFNPDFGMFEFVEESQLFWFNRSSLESLLQFELVGVILGLAMHNGIVLDLHFPRSAYAKLLDMPVSLADLEELHPSVCRSLVRVLDMSPETLSAADLTFSISDVYFDAITEQPLSPDIDKDTPVTVRNRKEYVKLYVQWLLQTSVASQLEAFRRGFMKCCSQESADLLSPDELQLVICGTPELDFGALERVVKYQDGYTADCQTIRDFWEVVHSLPPEEQRKLLFFVTGSDRVPITGLSSFLFFIGRNGSDVDRIPTSHTCFNFLFLPDYRDKEKLARYLHIALENRHGFGLR